MSPQQIVGHHPNLCLRLAHKKRFGDIGSKRMKAQMPTTEFGRNSTLMK